MSETTLPIVGVTFKEITVSRGDWNDQILFEAEDGRVWKMWHQPDCCEQVSIEDIVGEIEWLKGTPIVSAYESTSNEHPVSNYDESFTWTFYRFSTVLGTVVIRWYGSSNGYYSESVYFDEVTA